MFAELCNEIDGNDASSPIGPVVNVSTHGWNVIVLKYSHKEYKPYKKQLQEGRMPRDVDELMLTK